MDFLALRWFITDDELPAAERAVLERNGFRIDGQYGYALRWKRDGTSLARLVHQVDVLPDAQERVARLGAGYPLLERAIVEEPVQIDPGPAGSAADDVQASTQLDGTVDVRVRTDRRSLLVLADVWFPGAQVTVDGEPADLVRTDHAFRGVVVPAGEHQVRFTYTDRPLQFGAGLAALTVLGLALVPFVLRRRRRTDVPDAPADADDRTGVRTEEPAVAAPPGPVERPGTSPGGPDGTGRDGRDVVGRDSPAPGGATRAEGPRDG
jgi:hypothetical protein